MNPNLYRLALAALFTGTLWSLRKQAQQKRQAKAAGKVGPEAVQTWEHEGGALHGTGSHMGPEPTKP